MSVPLSRRGCSACFLFEAVSRLEAESNSKHGYKAVNVTHPGAFTIPIVSRRARMPIPDIAVHHNNQIAFGDDGKLYVGIGSLTDNGVMSPNLKDLWVVDATDQVPDFVQDQ